MKKSLKNIAVILAGGVGSRLGDPMPKQFTKIAGKTVLEHTISIFEKHKNIDEIYIVIHPQYINLVEDMILKNNWLKLSKILKGGKERYHSSLSAINACEEECNLIFHDAVRPLLSTRILDDIIEKLKDFKAIDVAIPVIDTIIEKNEEFISNIPDRSQLMRGQTPQAFKLSTIKKAYDLALEDPNLKVTDDCGIVKKYLPEEKIFIVNGEESNMKLTHKEDIFLLDKLFQLKAERISKRISKDGLDQKVAIVFGGSYGIGKCIVEKLEKLGLKVKSFSRSENGVDISSSSLVKKAISSVYKEYNRIDYVINTAAILQKKPLYSMSHTEIKKMIEVNYIGMVNVAKESYLHLKKTQGSLLLFTSSSYTRGRAFYSIYSSTKSAAVNFTQALAEEWEIDNIKVNCINPERTNTPMRTKNFGFEEKNTLLSAEKVADDSIYALLSDVSGQIFDVKIR